MPKTTTETSPPAQPEVGRYASASGVFLVPFLATDHRLIED